MYNSRVWLPVEAGDDLRRIIREFVETALLALLMFVALEFSVQNFKVEGASMSPTLGSGQYLLVNKAVYTRLDLGGLASLLSPDKSEGECEDGSVFAFHPPEHGEIVIFHYPLNPERDFVKRVIGVPGDSIEIVRGQVIRNGEPIDEPYVIEFGRQSDGPLMVPEGSYYVLGDNRRSSNDSRDWGLVPIENIVGRSWMVYWPPNSFGVFD